MKHPILTTLTLLATTLLAGTPGLGQDGNSGGFKNFSRGQDRSATGPTRPGPTEFKFTLTARGHTLIKDPAGNGLVVRENPGGKESEGTQFLPRTGLPSISMRQVSILLPYEAAFNGLQLQVLGEKTEQVGFFDIAPVSVAATTVEDDQGLVSLMEFVPDGVQLDDVGRDMVIYSSTSAWPAETLKIGQIAQHRALRYVRMAFAPFRWNPVTRELTKVTQVQAVLRWQPRPVPPAKRDLELGDPVPLPKMILQRFLDPKDALTTYLFPPRPTTFDYLIITTSQITQNSLVLDSFIKMKESQGHIVGVKTVEEIELSSPCTDDRADSIRKYLRANYMDLGIAHLLLIGDPDPDDQGDDSDSVGDVPMLMTWPLGAYTVAGSTDDNPVAKHYCHLAPTDMYYGDLTRPHWDQDGDGFPGERGGDQIAVVMDPTGWGIPVVTLQYACDFDMEIDVARITYKPSDQNKVATVDKQLAAQIEYQTAPMDDVLSTVRRRVLLSMAESTSTTDRASLGRKMSQDLLAYAGGKLFFPTALLQSLPCDVLLVAGALQGLWSDSMGAGLVLWTGHGSKYGSIFNQGDWVDLDGNGTLDMEDPTDMIKYYMVGNLTTDITRSIVISMSCSNASASNLFFLQMLMDNACVGVYANTGVTYFRSSRVADWGTMNFDEDVGYRIFRNLVNGCTIGASLAEMRRKGESHGWDNGTSVTTGSGTEAHCLLVANAFGDPTGRYITQ